MSHESFVLQFSVNKEDSLILFLEELANFQTSINAEFNVNGLLINVMDSCNTVLLNFYYHKNEFSCYKIKGKSSVVIGLSLLNIVNALKCAKSQSSINFEYKSKTPDWLFINTRISEDMIIDHKLPLLDIEALALEVPNSDYSIILKYNFKTLYETMNKLIIKTRKYTLTSILNNNNFFFLLKDDSRNYHKLKFSINSYDMDKELIDSDNESSDNKNIHIFFFLFFFPHIIRINFTCIIYL